VTIGVIGNPKAGRGRTDWDALVRRLGGAELWLTERPGHGTDFVAEARRAGVDTVVAVGGDGTVHEVVNGLLTHHTDATLGIVPLGSGCDYARTFGIPQDVAEACARITAPTPPRVVDAAEIRCRRGEEEHVRYFANIAEVGIGPECVARASRLPRFLGPAMYFAAFCITLPRYEVRTASIRMDAQTYEGRLVNLVVAIGQYFGGGMRVAPRADVADGLFDVQVQSGTKLDYVRGIPKVYRGTHVPHPRILEAGAATVEITSNPRGLIEADGEIVGHTPATFRILPGALRVKV
jgi:YegS/Rv2252/BmrU family lipid kinase